MNLTNILHRTTIVKWSLDRTCATIAYKLDGESSTLVLDPSEVGKYLLHNGFILLSVIHDGRHMIRYDNGERTVVMQWEEFVEAFTLSQYMCLRIVEAWYWNEKTKQLKSNVRTISPMIEGFLSRSF